MKKTLENELSFVRRTNVSLEMNRSRMQLAFLFSN
jgi:hypothetical protein